MLLNLCDGPRTDRFSPVPLAGNATLADLGDLGFSPEMAAAVEHAPCGDCVGWGIPFQVDRVVALTGQPVSVEIAPLRAQWLAFVHTSDVRPLEWNSHGIISPTHGIGRLGERAADYVVIYDDGSEERLPIVRRRQIGAFTRIWGENCFESVAHTKPYAPRCHHEQSAESWGRSQMRAESADGWPWVNWLWAWENPHPDRAIVGLRCEPGEGRVVLSALSAGSASSQPLRWDTRRKAVLTLPEGLAFRPELDERGLLEQIRLDMGQVISATPRRIYPCDSWEDSYNNCLPQLSDREIVVEYTSHPDAAFYLWDGSVVPVSALSEGGATLRVVRPATRRVTLRVVERGGRQPVAVKLHLHGEEGEYLAPVDRHRIPNNAWFEDYSVDFVHLGAHYCTYIPGETRVNLPLGRVYLEVAKGFEIRPIRRVLEITPDTEEVVIEVERVLPWRAKGWVSADTHVHFLSPGSAMLEGAGEGVNVVNLLASQWGELMTNVGDFDGRTTWGSREAGGDGEYLVRVGTENRQHVLGHISLLGYDGGIISPMTSGGPNESALGDPIEVLLTEWARQCHRQGGVVVIPHFPNPRAEHAAAIAEGEVDAVEMTAWGDLYSGINPYSLADWYRYLNCGYKVAAVGGTDKMWAGVAVGTVRTYARIPDGQAFDYRAWKEAVRRGETFVTYGPLIEFGVAGQPMGGGLQLGRGGGTLDVTWEAASVTVPMSRVEIIVNGEIRESVAVDPWQAAGSWSVPVERSSWLALLVRGHYPDRPEMVAAHSSPVMAEVEGTPFFAAADAVTILEQIEGAMAYLDTVGTRAETATYRRMRLVLEGAHRRLHNRLHQEGRYHEHTPTDDHPEHHR